MKIAALALTFALSVVAAACTGSDEPVAIVPTSTTAPAVAQPTAARSAVIPPLTTATAAPATTATSSATPTTEASTATPAPPSAPTPPPEVRDGDADGFPFSTVDFRFAVEDGRGYSWWLIEDRQQVCQASAVPGRPYWSANLLGSDFGPVLTLWVYPHVDALRADWDAVPGEAPIPRFDCELPSGFVYWNENLILAFDAWLSAGEELPLAGHHESPTDMPATQAFLNLAP